MCFIKKVLFRVVFFGVFLCVVFLNGLVCVGGCFILFYLCYLFGGFMI